MTRTMIINERRHHARRSVAQSVKVRCSDTGRYVTGHTCDISACGALLEIHKSSKLAGGQHLELGIAWNPRQVLLGSTQLKGATVVRSFCHGPTQHVAVRFDQPMELAAVA